MWGRVNIVGHASIHHFHLIHAHFGRAIIADNSSLDIVSVLMTRLEPATVGFRAQVAYH